MRRRRRKKWRIRRKRRRGRKEWRGEGGEQERRKIYQTKKFLYRKGGNQWDEKATYRKKKIFANHIPDIQNI